MKLIRIATVYFGPAPDGWESWALSYDRCLVTTISVRAEPPQDGRKRLLVAAQTELDALPPIAPDGLITPPVTLRTTCERGIEAAANVISVLTGSARHIASPIPPLAFLPASASEREYLAQARGIRYSNRALNRPWSRIGSSPAVMQGLADRLDGVGLFADLLAQQHPIARYREALRFFELAFRLPAVQLERKLAQFLAGTDAGYMRSEIAAWLSGRHSATHGDRRITTTLIVEADVRSFIPRMEQAAMDVLLNKAEWHNPSRKRRHLYKFPAVTIGPSHGLRIIQGSTDFVLEAQLLDPFGAYPLDLSATFFSAPDEWWCPYLGKEDIEPTPAAATVPPGTVPRADSSGLGAAERGDASSTDRGTDGNCGTG